MPCAAIGAGWMPWVLICADCRPIRSTAISCIGFRWTVVATPTPGWLGNPELGAWGVTDNREQSILDKFKHTCETVLLNVELM